MRKEDKVRRLIAQEAARIMYEEGVSEYRDAKRKAARHFGPEKALSLGSHLPSNAEIHGELQRIIGIYEEEALPERLLHLRLVALRQMELLAPFRPYLVGSVLSGAVTERSDIDLHLFAESCEEVEEFLDQEEIPFETEVVTIRHGENSLITPTSTWRMTGLLSSALSIPSRIFIAYRRAASRENPWNAPMRRK